MKKKMIVAAALLSAISLAAFANPVMYVKGVLGYSQRNAEFDSTYRSLGDIGITYRAFTAVPAFGIAPWRAQESKNAFLRGLSFEISVGLDFGSTDDVSKYVDMEPISVYAITPGIMAVYSRPSGRLIPYGGIGLSIPIVIAPALKNEPWNGTVPLPGGDGAEIYETDNVAVGVDVDLMLGIGYAVTKNIMPVIEVAGKYHIAFGGIGWGARAGCVFKFGG